MCPAECERMTWHHAAGKGKTGGNTNAAALEGGPRTGGRFGLELKSAPGRVRPRPGADDVRAYQPLRA